MNLPLPLGALKPTLIADASPGTLLLVPDSERVSLYVRCDAKQGTWILGLDGPMRYRTQNVAGWHDSDAIGYPTQPSQWRLDAGTPSLASGDPRQGTIRIGDEGPFLYTATGPHPGAPVHPFWLALVGFLVPAGAASRYPRNSAAQFEAWCLSIVVDSTTHTIATGPAWSPARSVETP